nr:histidine kinase dimerization/phospho-acceptor domain-containing protein [Thalassobaculum litoreum]
MAFLAVILPLVITVVGGFFVLLEVETYNDAVERLEMKLDRTLASNSVMLARAVWERNEALIASQAVPALIDPDLIGIFITDRAGRTLADFGARETPLGKSITGEAPIRFDAGADLQEAGRLELVMTDAGIRASARSRTLVLIAFAILLSVAIVFAAQAAFDLVIGRPLKELQKAIDSTRLGAPREEVQWSGADEVARVIEAFNRMQRRHTAYENALDEARIDLEQRVEERTVELKRARDEARAANRAKSAFLANMSHELRTPLNAIIGFAEVLKNQKFGPLGDERYSSYAEIVRTSGTHLLDLINDLLDLSRAEAGGLIPADSTLAVDAQIRRAIDMSRTEIDASGLTVRVAVDADVPARRSTTAGRCRSSWPIPASAFPRTRSTRCWSPSPSSIPACTGNTAAPGSGCPCAGPSPRPMAARSLSRARSARGPGSPSSCRPGAPCRRPTTLRRRKPDRQVRRCPGYRMRSRKIVSAIGVS